MTFDFPSSYRILNEHDFMQVFQARKVIRSEFLCMHFLPHQPSSRLGFSIGKKFVTRANRRNTIKRIARETYRLQRHALPACWIVIRVQKKITKLSQAQFKQLIHQELQILFSHKYFLNFLKTAHNQPEA